MTDPSPRIDLNAIRARADAATDGPWWAWGRGVGYAIALGAESQVDECGRPLARLPEGDRTDIGRREDAEFIAHTRQDVPMLLAEIDRLQAELASFRGPHRHLIEFRVDGWTIQHPPSCRPNLFVCTVNRAAERHLISVPDVLGVYECGVDADGHFMVVNRSGAAERPVDLHFGLPR